jgi:hypothetical protein
MSEQDQQLMQESEGGGLQNIGDWITPGAPLKAAQWGLGAAMSAPLVKGGFNYLKKKATDPKNLKKLQNLKNKLFKRFDEPVRPKFPIMNKSQEAAWRKLNPGKWLYDKYKLAGWGGAGGLSLTQLMQQMGGEKPVSKADTDPSSPTYKGGREARAGRGPAPEPNAMQRLGSNMKDPKWWHESMSGLPTDTRLMRLGQLMDYYGKTPKGRKESTAPAELWAANEVAHGKNVAAAMDKSDSYKWSYKNVETSLGEWFEEKFGTDWWGGKDRDALKEKFIRDVTDEKARYPTRNLEEIAEALLKEHPDRYL